MAAGAQVMAQAVWTMAANDNGFAGMDEEQWRSNVEEWTLCQNVDDNASRIMRSLPRPSQAAVMAQGHVTGPLVRNTSALLMKRIHHVHQAWVPYVVPAVNERAYVERIVVPPPKSIIVFVRGEANRHGGNREHSKMSDFGNFETNMESIQRFVVQPIIDLGEYKVFVMGDIMTVDGGEAEVSRVMAQTFGRCFIDVRPQKHLFGMDQVGSLMSSWDWLWHCCNQRAFLATVKGVFFVRADVELLAPGFHNWPHDHLCFLWWTWVRQRKEQGVNDVVFYVPSDLFELFRTALSQARTRGATSMHWQDLHWLGSEPAWKEYVWIEYKFNHPSNTEKNANPRYRITGRPTNSSLESGKFDEYDLRAKPDYWDLKDQWVQYNDHKKQELWNESVTKLLSESNGQIDIHDFKSLWYKAFDDVDLDWIMPFTEKTGASCKTVPGVIYVWQHQGGTLQLTPPKAAERRQKQQQLPEPPWHGGGLGTRIRNLIGEALVPPPRPSAAPKTTPGLKPVSKKRPRGSTEEEAPKKRPRPSAPAAKAMPRAPRPSTSSSSTMALRPLPRGSSLHATRRQCSRFNAAV